ncbi:MAG: hypothetical protein RLZZ352_1716 [Pseudomonadota bacterium]|jgi:type III restriction enzyme
MTPQAQFQYSRLAHQAQAVQAISEVFADVPFAPPADMQANPTFSQAVAHAVLKANIAQVRAAHGVTIGPVQVATSLTPALNLDVLMETGTGKTFTFIETIHKLHQQRGLSKFVVLVPSNAIRQGTLKSLQTTAAFFAREYDNQKIHVVNYSDKTVKAFIHGANRGLWVMVATYQSFAGDSKLINKRGVEANLFGRAKSYMEALAQIRPVLIIDEPHRFEGKVVQEYLSKFNPLLTVRFGATFKKDEYRNLIYTLDSLEAFRQRLVKGITVDTVGTGHDAGQVLCLHEVTGPAKERSARVGYQTAMGKAASVVLQAKDNLGQRTGLSFLDGHVVDKVAAKELLFTNGFALPLGEPTAYGMLAEEVQSLIIERAVASHFEREEALFRRGIKSLTLFFIDAVGKYLPEGVAGKTRPAVVREAFERHYRTQLALTLAKPGLDAGYRAYLERTQADVGRVHKGYFARSHSEKGEEEAIKLILQEKEKLLSFDTDLRFIFSMWALQEGWDNPNVFTLCKLAPSHSKISKLQQIGRGLRLAVNQQLARVQADDAAFDEINDLTVVVPASEGDFVAAIQSEISQHSVRRVGRTVTQESLMASGISTNPFVTVALLTALAQCGAGVLDMATGSLCLQSSAEVFKAQRVVIEQALKAVPNLGAVATKAMLDYLDAYYDGAGRIKTRQDKAAPTLTPNPAQYQQFRHLWDNLNRDAVLRYELDTAVLVQRVLARVAASFEVRPLSVQVTRTSDVQQVHEARTTQSSYAVQAHAVMSLKTFVRTLAQQTRLSVHTISTVLAQMPPEKFAQIRHNENRALRTLSDLILRCVYELVVNRVSYELREVRVKTALTDNTGTLLKTLALAQCGTEVHPIQNPAVQEKSLYAEPLMPVDSQIERATVDESQHDSITVFAKLPKINIPTPTGHYNPDFGYVIRRAGQAQALYLVVETKGYDSEADIPEGERWKLQSARRFFEALQAQGVPVRFETKINQAALASLIQPLLAGTS